MDRADRDVNPDLNAMHTQIVCMYVPGGSKVQKSSRSSLLGFKNGELSLTKRLNSLKSQCIMPLDASLDIKSMHWLYTKPGDPSSLTCKRSVLGLT